MKRFFTLIELLVVIAIIVILAAMLMPALNKARDSARKATCASQMKQFGAVAASYAADNKDFLFQYNATNPTYWYALAYPTYIGQNSKIWWCPQDNGNLSDPVNNLNWCSTWGFVTYGFNNYFLRGYRLARAKNTSKMVLFAESATNIDTAPRGYYFSYPWGGQVAAFPFHGYDCNITWLDGHVASVRGTGFPGTRGISNSLFAANLLGWNSSTNNCWNPEQ